jgi:hypothetical protein
VQIHAYWGDLRFDIAFLTERLVAAGRWLSSQPVAQYLPRGYFGSSTGAAAALAAAASFERIGKERSQAKPGSSVA